MDKTSLGNRMKAYENIERRYLPRRAPLIIRIDGKSFHSFTKGFDRPFDDSFLDCMRATMLHLCEIIMGAKLGYTQSDEISILVTDDDTLETDAWFGKNLQKIVSITAALATKFFAEEVMWRAENHNASEGLQRAYFTNRIAVFDARAFTIPREEVLNAFEWRQQDATRNSIQAVGQAFFSHKELDHKSCNAIQNMLLVEKGINWNNYPTALQRGVCARQVPVQIENGTWRNKWKLDTEIPIFHKHPEYINDLVYHKETSNGNR